MSEPASDVEVQPAATVMLVRDAGTGGRQGGRGLEVLMLRRHPESVFAADAWVFPGGRVDAGDRSGAPIAIRPSDAEASATLGLPSGGLPTGWRRPGSASRRRGSSLPAIRTAAPGS